MIKSIAAAHHPWSACLASLRKKLSDEAFGLWIAPLKLADCNEFQVNLSAPPGLDLEQLNKLYLGLIEHCFQEANGGDARVQIKRAPGVPGGHSFTSMPAIGLNPDYTFEEFVVGSHSRFVHSAAMAVAENPGGTAFNPMLIYGASGLGKTHLLQAIGNFVLARSPRKKVRYVTSETFYREFVDSIKENRINELSTYYRKEVDLLLVDDVQFMIGKDRTQEEFFHIFNTLHQSRKQIVLTSDAAPGKLKGLEARLVSRFQWGLAVDVQPPDRETREAILQRKARALNLDISEDIIAYLAEAIDSNIRILEGAIRQLLLQASIRHSDITMELAQEVAHRAGNGRSARKITAEDVATAVADHFAVETDKLLQPGRGTKEVAKARQLAMFLMKDLTTATFKAIGLRFGGRDHSTVVHAVKATAKSMEKDPGFRKNVDSVMERLSVRA